MCGIVGYTGNKPAQEIVIDSLKKLEYRGYDSSGIALHEGKIVFSKKEGPIVNLESILKSSDAKMAIAHTRWATHGVPSCLLYTSPSPRDATLSRMPSSA